jgi:hypothetical protein
MPTYMKEVIPLILIKEIMEEKRKLRRILSKYKDVVVSYWKDKKQRNKYYVQFAYDNGKIFDVFTVDKKKLEEIKKRYKDSIIEE